MLMMRELSRCVSLHNNGCQELQSTNFVTHYSSIWWW